jgi:hypothetical protein
MKIPSKIAAATGVVTAAGAIATFAATPALAASGVLLPNLGVGGNGTHHVIANCTADGGVATSLNQITYVISADATAASTNGSLAIGTSLQCFAYNVDTNHIYGSASGGLPGAGGVAVGIVTVPTSANAALCVKATALFNDNATASFDSCPF